MIKNIVIGVLALIILAGGFYFYQGTVARPAMTSGDNNVASEQPSTEGKRSVRWKFTSAGYNEEMHVERTRVTLEFGGKSYEGGTYDGTCAEIDGGSITLLEDEVSGAFCYFAGYGDEIGLFRDGDTYVVRHGEYQEPNAESDEFRGNFTLIAEIGK